MFEKSRKDEQQPYDGSHGRQKDDQIAGNDLYTSPAEPVRDHDHTAFGDKSPGVLRIEAIASGFTAWHKWVLFIAVLLVAYSYGLDGGVRSRYQDYALASFSASAQISTITVVRSIVAAAAQPAYAKISDYFGRLSILFISIVFYVVGSIVMTASKNVPQISGGAVLYQFGYTGVQLLVEVIIADTTSLRNRLFFSYIPAAPFLINAWISGNVVSAVIEGENPAGWRWGIGMWCIIFPVTTIPLFYSFIHARIRAQRAGLMDGIPSPYRALFTPSLWSDIFWQLDIVGLFLVAGAFITILLPFTFAGSSTNAGSVRETWASARAIAPLVVGIVVILPLFVYWEAKVARHPFVPFRLLKSRGVLTPLAMATLLNTAWYMQGDYLYPFIIVAFDKSIEVATRVSSIYSFVSVVIGLALGLVIRYVRHIKWFAVAGTWLFVLAFGLLIRFRGGTTGPEYAGFIAAEVILGIGGGMFPYPVQVLIQSAVAHEHTATVTALYLACYSIGSALGNAIAGAIWINTLPDKILLEYGKLGIENTTSGLAAYGDPYTFVGLYPVGTPERTAFTQAYMDVQRLLCITGICIAVLLALISLTLHNPTLGDKQSLEGAEKDSMAEGEKTRD